ncbi:MAG TPA: glycoside hydrolase family 3 N-terminal domain-containing protein [Solirubrobacterales bacterium]|nr:glycoside hydrolase family 3 N-terminal domain-containing protein [Solirubrobacterales bacterium]
MVIVKSGVFATGSQDWPSGETTAATLESSSQPTSAPKPRGADERLPPASAGGAERMPARLALGQMIVARFDGANPTPAFIARIRRGEIGGVIFFEEGLKGGKAAIAARVERLQAAARQGDNPPLLVMVDQEGGSVKRLPGPPAKAAAAMTADDAEAEGEATGDYLAQLGIDVDLAPVADVHHPGSFLGSRTFASQPDEVASLACAFAAGLRSQGIAATLKHFPGLGQATVNTDEAPVTVDASAAALRADYAPYEACAGEPRTLVMVDTAVYPRLTGNQPAVMSPETYKRELPRVGADGVTISDDLEAPAVQNETTPARRSVDAGLDLLLYARTEATSADAYARLLEDVESGAIPAPKVEAAATKVLALKAELAG